MGRLKSARGETFFAPERERTILARLARTNPGPLTAEALRAIYREIFSTTLALEHPRVTAYLGPEDTFTHVAALQQFGTQADYRPCTTISDVFAEVERGRADCGVVPIENSIEGAVNHTLDMFMESPLVICAEVLLKISHSLVAKGPRRQIRTVYSHPQVFGQCRQWLERHLPQVELVEVSSTATAAERAARHRFAAAIATPMAARRHGLKILASSIQDHAENVTRFLVIGTTQSTPTGEDKTSLMFSVKDRVGALHDMLIPFKRQRINLTKIESRPSKRRPWEYYFFVDLIGHALQPKVQRALRMLERQCTFLKILGAYPMAEPPR